MNSPSSKHYSRFARSRRGFTMLPMILFMFVIVGLVSAGMLLVGPRVELGKTVEAKAGLEKGVDAIISWSVANGRLPDNVEFAAILPYQNDPWSRPYVYTYDGTLANAATGGLCGRTTTTVFNGQQIAFVMLSGGNDFLVTSLPALSGPFVGPPTLLPADIFRIVTLDELKNRAGCFGSTQGRLKILNNELPKGCVGNVYSATIFGSGGVAPYPAYAIAGLPVGLTAAGQTINGTPTVTGTFPVSVSISDSHTPTANTIQKNLGLTITSCGAPPTPPVVTFNDAFNAGVSGQGNSIAITQDPTSGTVSASAVNGTGSACLWYGTPMALTGKKLRAYFNYSFSSGEGFVLALIPASVNTPPINCGQGGANLGFDANIPGNTILGIEFDANRNIPKNDPSYNHLGIVANSVQHNNATNNACSTTAGGQCYFTSSADTWSDNGAVYNVRVELDATTSPYIMKVWLCPVGAGVCSAADITALSTISAAAYGGAISPAITRTLTATQVSDLGSFIFGFTMSQTGNNTIDLSLAGLTFGTF